MNKRNEPCSICEEFIEGVICDKDKCPVGIMKKEFERLHNLQKAAETSGFKIENGKVVFYSNMLNGYRHEYKDLDEVVKELNLLLQNAYKIDDVMLHYKAKAKTARFEAYKEFAERFKRYVTTAERKPSTILNYSAFGIVNMIDLVYKELTEGI